MQVQEASTASPSSSAPARVPGKMPQKHAVETATKTLRDLRVAEVSKLDLVIIDGKVTAFRARVNLSFKYEEKD